MAFTTIKEWLETHSLNSDRTLVGREMRYTRRLGRKYNEELKTSKEFAEAFATGDQDKILKALMKHTTVVFMEIELLKSIVIKHKTLLNRNLDKLQRLEQDIVGNKNAANKEELIRKIRGMEKQLEDAILSLLQRFTSFQNTNYTTMKLLDRASQLRDEFYQLRLSRGDVKEYDKDIASIENDARAGKITEDKKMERLLAALKEELEHQTHAMSDAMLILSEMVIAVSKEKLRVAEERDHDQYPKAWAEKDLAELSDLEKQINEWVATEISEGRVFLSKAKRAA